jgi:hypothetical protein
VLYLLPFTLHPYPLSFTLYPSPFTIHYLLFAIHYSRRMPNLQSLLHPILEHAAFRSALRALTADSSAARSPVTISGLTSSTKALVVAGVAHQLSRPVVVLTSDNETAAHLQRSLRRSFPTR